MPLRDGNLQALKPRWLFTSHLQSKNQDLILLLSQRAGWLSSGTFCVFPPWVWASGGFSEGRLGGVAIGQLHPAADLLPTEQNQFPESLLLKSPAL